MARKHHPVTAGAQAGQCASGRLGCCVQTIGLTFVDESKQYTSFVTINYQCATLGLHPDLCCSIRFELFSTTSAKLLLMIPDLLTMENICAGRFCSQTVSMS